MGRPPLRVGAHGNIRTKQNGRTWIAATYLRDGDGRRREVRREGRSKSAAIQNLHDALDDRTGFSTSDITRESPIKQVAGLWLEKIARQVDSGELAANSLRVYESVYRGHIEHALGELRLREATVARLDSFIVTMRAHHGGSLTKTARTVLNGILGYAVRNGALPANPMREVSRVPGDAGRIPRAMTDAERAEWLQRLDTDLLAVRHDLPDITRFLLGTGVRLGECLGATFDDVDLVERTLRIDHQVQRVKGKGLVRTRTKTQSSRRTLHMPGSVADMVERRLGVLGDGPIFPSGADGWRDPSNTARVLREARERAGFGWVTSHVFRKTVATVLDEAGLSTRVVADQLGHSRLSITQDFYMGRQAVAQEAAAALDAAANRTPA